MMPAAEMAEKRCPKCKAEVLQKPGDGYYTLFACDSETDFSDFIQSEACRIRELTQERDTAIADNKELVRLWDEYGPCARLVADLRTLATELEAEENKGLMICYASSPGERITALLPDSEAKHG